MKKFLSLTLALSLGLSAAIANPFPAAGNKFNEALKYSFAGAEIISWKSVRNTGLQQAAFYLNNQRFHAYYNESAQLVATVRFVQASNLPLHIHQSITGNYSGCAVTEVAEMVQNGITEFYITIQHNNKEIMLRADEKGMLKNIYSKKIN